VSLWFALAAACGERHDVRGLVLKVDAAAGMVTVSHDAVPGYMDAMAMPFAASRPSDLKGVRPGDRIEFRLSVRGGRSTIGGVKILSAAPADAGLLRSPAASTLVALNQPIPDFTLVDQDGRRVSLSSLRGKTVAVSFIYTRCPLPDYCPLAMKNLAALRDEFRDRLGKDLVLLTVTFDPKYDTPQKLKEYAKQYGADIAGWRLLTGSAAEVERVCSLFGVESWPEEGMITHTLQTAIIDREGRLVATVEGRGYSTRQLADLVRESLIPDP
jgi:protein SCO1